MTTSPSAVATAPAWPLWTYRIVATVAAVLLFVQSILAGEFLGDKNDKFAFMLHRENAILATVIVLVLVVAAILTVWPGGGPKSVLPRAIGLLVVTAGEAAAGFAKLTQLHVPLGVLLIGIAIMMAVLAWRPPRVRAVSAA
jgi:membrane protein DedA with SNARE-associated domain